SPAPVFPVITWAVGGLRRDAVRPVKAGGVVEVGDQAGGAFWRGDSGQQTPVRADAFHRAEAAVWCDVVVEAAGLIPQARVGDLHQAIVLGLQAGVELSA